jgi:hypothetical protein
MLKNPIIPQEKALRAYKSEDRSQNSIYPFKTKIDSSRPGNYSEEEKYEKHKVLLVKEREREQIGG